MAKTKSGTRDPLVDEYMEIFSWAYSESQNDLQRLKQLRNTYDNMVDESLWPTESQIPVPVTFAMVEKALPGAVEYLFPKEQMLRLNPLELGVRMESVHKSEWALEHMIRRRMKLQHCSYQTLKDCFALGLGYGIVEPITVSPPTAVMKQVLTGSTVMEKSRTIEVGGPKKTVRYRYVAPGQIIVTQDGTDFNGVNSVSAAFFVDTYSEQQFKDMYDDDVSNGEKPPVEGNPDEIIKEARQFGFSPRVPIVSIVKDLAGPDLTKKDNSDERIPVTIPVLKVYLQHRHIWIANGTTIVLDQEDKYQTLRRPLIKASAWPDALRWYPMSAPEAAEHMSWGLNVWINALFDLMSHYIRPIMMYDKQKFQSPPERGPNATIGAQGSVDQAAAFLRGPDIPAQLFTIGELLRNQYGDSVAQQDFLTRPEPGLLRGGAFAFESLLQISDGRKRLAGAILQTGWLESVVEQTLTYMQLNIGPEGDVWASRNWDPESEEEYLEEMTVTEEDLVNAYEVEIDLDAKYANTAASFAQKQADLQNGLASEFTDKYEVLLDYYGSEVRAKRLLKSRDQIREMDRENRMLEMRERAEGVERARAARVPAGQEVAAGVAPGGPGLQ